MKLAALRLAGAAAPLVLSGTAAAHFAGLQGAVKLVPSDFKDQIVAVFNLYATFDQPGDKFLAAVGTPDSPMDIEVYGGTFYQNQFGTDTPPNAILFPFFPSLQFDSFVTIGQKSFGPGGNGPATILTLIPAWPGWPGFQATSLGAPNPQATNMGWAVTPNDPNSDPFNPIYNLGNGHVLIGQFSVSPYSCNPVIAGVNGSFKILVSDADSGSEQYFVSFDIHEHLCPWDLDGDYMVGIVDFLSLLAAWGPSPDHFADFDCNGDVDQDDFLMLLFTWGHCL